MKPPHHIEFNRPSKYTLLSYLGRGACGHTVHLRDEGMACEFVAKKYQPIISEDEDPVMFFELLDRFREEARILFRLNHANIVRVFNFFDYIEHRTAYILMEFIAGTDVLSYLEVNPANANRVFEGVVDGFAHLESQGVLHRDIRPANILVDTTGTAKIIDFGFGKQINLSVDLDDRKSISLNWWCEIPPEFAEEVYDFQTEVYFVGKLFELAVMNGNLSEFKYISVLGLMCEKDRKRRIASFSEVQRVVLEGKFEEIRFTASEIAIYRKFADDLLKVVSSIQTDARLETDAARILKKLEDLYRMTMLEEALAAPEKLALIFINGAFRYKRNARVLVENMNLFIHLIRGMSEEKRSIVLENLLLRLQKIERESFNDNNLDDEIPF